jgi:hypothetical protein
MDYDIIYTDERNATTDHRTGGGGGRPSPWRPMPSRTGGGTGTRTVVVPPGGRPTVITGSASGYYQPPYYGPQMPYYPQSMPSFASRFGLTTGELIDTGVQLIAAILPLPGAPVAQGEAVTDVENLMTYQGALAGYAKRDEQLRTLGTLLTRILR